MLCKESITSFMDRLSKGEYSRKEWTTFWIREYVGITGYEIYYLQKHSIIPRARRRGRLCVWSNEELCIMLRHVLDFIDRYNLSLCFTAKYGWIMKKWGHRSCGSDG